VAIAAVVAAAVPVVAAADEAPTLLPGGTAVVKGSRVSCTVTAASVSCTKTGGLTATLNGKGTVRVTKGSRRLFSTFKHMRLSVNDGFVLTDPSVYCHVYAAGVPTLSCALVNPVGGLPKTHGFDISDRAVVVSVYDSKQQRHDIKTLSQP
jgi:hypothetical protein